MALLLPNGAIFLHVPKTGGNYVTKVLRDQNLVLAMLGDKHDDAARLLVPPTKKHSLKEWRGYARTYASLRGNCVPRTFIAVRHPFSWYESWFKYQSQKNRNWRPFGQFGDILNWHPNAELNRCSGQDFQDFVKRVVERCPAYVTRLYGRFHGSGDPLVMKNETLSKDLVAALKYFGIDHDSHAILKSSRVGESEFIETFWTRDLRKLVAEIEIGAFRRYGYSIESTP